MLRNTHLSAFQGGYKADGETAKGSEMDKNRHFSATENGYNRNRDYIDYYLQIEGLIPIGIILTALGIRTPNHRTC